MRTSRLLTERAHRRLWSMGAAMGGVALAVLSASCSVDGTGVVGPTSLPWIVTTFPVELRPVADEAAANLVVQILGYQHTDQRFTVRVDGVIAIDVILRGADTSDPWRVPEEWRFQVADGARTVEIVTPTDSKSATVLATRAPLFVVGQYQDKLGLDVQTYTERPGWG